MQWVLILLVGCVVLGALQYALAALVIALIILLLWGAIVHPESTLGTLAFFLLASVFVNHTAACLTFLAFVGVCLLISGRSTTDANVSAPDEGSPDA